jgi:hypothetical protein
MVRRTNKTIAPLFMLVEQAVLSKSQMMERRLAKAKIEYVGKHIPTTARNKLYTNNTISEWEPPRPPRKVGHPIIPPQQIFIAHSPLRSKMRTMRT